MDFVGPEAEGLLTWGGLLKAFEAGHAKGKPEIADLFLYRGGDTMLDRAAWISGIGALVKVATVVPGNASRGVPTINGVVNLFDDVTGELTGIVDFHLVTKWKTAGDSLYAASKLARKDARRFLLVGAGTVARSMVGAYRSLWPDAEFAVWNRTPAGAEEMARDLGIAVARDLEQAVGAADVICTATMAKAPVIKGEWLRPGVHLDLIGAYNPSMREVDDEAMRRARVFVDAKATTVHHIGELIDPIASGALREEDIVADFYAGDYRRIGDEITIAKNGGGAHLDLMTARYILDQWQAR
jgi:ornithine cyclodeaminase